MIELKCERDHIGSGREEKLCEVADLVHDALVAHALMQAIDEVYSGTGYQTSPTRVVGFIKDRAAEILSEDFGVKP